MIAGLSKITGRILNDIALERKRQDAKWGPQRNQPDGTGGPMAKKQADDFREICDSMFASGRGEWKHILAEEFFEALAESDPRALRKELVQVAAVAAAWIEDIDTRTQEGGSSVTPT